MRSARPFRSGRILAAANVVAMVALLAGKTPEYDLLRAQDESRARGGIDFIDSEAPLWVGARPLYVGELVAVPLVDRLFAIVNVPALLATLVVSFPMWIALGAIGSGTSSAFQSWATAAVLLAAVAAWGWVVGALVDWVAQRRGAV